MTAAWAFVLGTVFGVILGLALGGNPRGRP